MGERCVALVSVNNPHAHVMKVTVIKLSHLNKIPQEYWRGTFLGGKGSSEGAGERWGGGGGNG